MAAEETRGSDHARQWAQNLARQFGEAVRFYRNRLGLSAVQLSSRTKEIGYPITRGAIAKIEGNHRNGKMDLAEVLTLAAALEVAPIDLVFPGYPSWGIPMLPKFTTTSAEARMWFNSTEDFNSFGRPHVPRVDISQELQRKTTQVAENIKRAEAALHLNSQHIPDPSRITKEEAQAILVDLQVAKALIEQLGGSFAGTSWEHLLREMVDDPETNWAPL